MPCLMLAGLQPLLQELLLITGRALVFTLGIMAPYDWAGEGISHGSAT